MTLQEAYAEGFVKQAESMGVNPYRLMVMSNAPLEKRAFGGFFDDAEGNTDWSKILKAALGLLGTGFVAYQAGIKGDPSKSAWHNFTNYGIGTFRNLVRVKDRPALYDPNGQISAQKGLTPPGGLG